MGRKLYKMQFLGKCEKNRPLGQSYQTEKKKKWIQIKEITFYKKNNEFLYRRNIESSQFCGSTVTYKEYSKIPEKFYNIHLSQAVLPRNLIQNIYAIYIKVWQK